MEDLQAEIDAFQLGTPAAPSGTTPSVEYFLSRAKVLGMSYLKRCKQMGLDSDLAAAERLQTKTSRQVKAPDALDA